VISTVLALLTVDCISEVYILVDTPSVLFCLDFPQIYDCCNKKQGLLAAISKLYASQWL